MRPKASPALAPRSSVSGVAVPNAGADGAAPAVLGSAGRPRAGNPFAARKAAKKRVLFVCIGNSCRSQMAEAFARAYGSDVLEIRSAGLTPATLIAPLTKQILSEHNLNIEDHFPKGMDWVAKEQFDLLINMSGKPVSLPGAQVFNWLVEDPIGKSAALYRAVASQIERLVMRLILDVRNTRDVRNTPTK